MSLLTAKGSTDDDGTLRFSIPEGLAHMPLDVLQDAIRTVRLTLADLEREESRRQQAPPPPEPDRAVGLDEAGKLFGMTRAYLERRTNWQRLGGFRDHDGHVKFLLSSIQRHLKTQKLARLP